MLDSAVIKRIRTPINIIGKFLGSKGISANQMSSTGFMIGICAVPAIVFHAYEWALLFILINRVCDGLDGAIARAKGITDAGGFLDISLDFVFYAAIPFSFILADPDNNAIPGAFLLFSFFGAGCSFLAFAVMAEKQKISDPIYENKSIYYLSGLTEGTETIICFILMVVFPSWFSVIAYTFSFMCCLTALSRIYGGFTLLSMRQIQHMEQGITND